MLAHRLPSFTEMIRSIPSPDSSFGSSPSASPSPSLCSSTFGNTALFPETPPSVLLNHQPSQAAAMIPSQKPYQGYQDAAISYHKLQTPSVTYNVRTPAAQGPGIHIKTESVKPIQHSPTRSSAYRIIKPPRPVHHRHYHHPPTSQTPNTLNRYSRSLITPLPSPLIPSSPIYEQPAINTPHLPIFVDRQEKRRRNHLNSEKKRRENIKCGMDALFDLVPSCLDKGESKAQVLRKTRNYVLELRYEVERLRREMDGLRAENETLRTPGRA